jgi:hypothetical protein
MSEKTFNDLDNSNAEVYRRKLLEVAEQNRNLINENKILLENVTQLQEQLQCAYIRIRELIDRSHLEESSISYELH